MNDPYPVGTEVEKINSEPGDKTKEGQKGKIVDIAINGRDLLRINIPLDEVLEQVPLEHRKYMKENCHMYVTEFSGKRTLILAYKVRKL